VDEAFQTAQLVEFERHRRHLRAIAYRMLGSMTDAEDAVQEAWIRLNRVSEDSIDNMPAWLTTVIGRVCIDMLRARRSRPEDYVGAQLPQVFVDTERGADPEEQSLIAESVGMAMLVVLDKLTPSERLAFVLHDTFGVPFDDIAPIIDRTPEAARQLASRARRRVRGAAAVGNPDAAKQREVVDAFLAAARAGDFEALLNVLDPDVTFRIDPGARVWFGPVRITGAAEVARHSATQGPRFATLCHPAQVRGTPGVVARTPDALMAIVEMTFRDGLIASIDLVLDPDKLAEAEDYLW
jgi:RNA polymerase sigma-70 factor (ECF subfamily)